MGRLAGDPKDVAKAIERAISARHPRTRYPVTAGARLLLTLHALLPDRAWDRFMRRSIPEPDPDPALEPDPPTTTDGSGPAASVANGGGRSAAGAHR
jgi:hypothetical protein